jgi:hypothetical protein
MRVPGFLVPVFLLFSFSSFSLAQPQSPNSANLQQEVNSLRGEVAEQQEQVEELRRTVDQLLHNATPSAEKSAIAPAPAQPTAAALLPATAQPAAAKRTETTAAQSMAERFHFGGDVRIRFDAIRQDNVQDRNRVLLRARFGVEGKAGEDFIGGAYLATGTLGDNPTGTNQILSESFTRKAIGLDRAWITYAPRKLKWIELTGGKFAYTWIRTPMTFDPDLNPEGFSERIAIRPRNSVVRSVSFTGMQLLFNEVAAPSGTTYAANDSFAAGGQVTTAQALGKRVSTTISGTALNWHGANAIAQVMSLKVLRANLNTNAATGTGLNTQYLSSFLYVGFTADTTIKTPLERWPVRFVLDYDYNPRAYSDQNSGILSEVSIGRLQKTHDFQFGYGFARVEQDAVIAAFAESEFRAPPTSFSSVPTSSGSSSPTPPHSSQVGSAIHSIPVCQTPRSHPVSCLDRRTPTNDAFNSISFISSRNSTSDG